MYKFVTPHVEEQPAGEGDLFERYRLNRGVTVLKIDGEYYEMRYPSEDEFELADVVYMGGHEYEVSDEEAADLEDAGYEVVAI